MEKKRNKNSINCWLAKENPQTYIDNNWEGFVYKITNKKTKKFYIGKKSFHRGTKWQNYFGSSKDLKEDIKKLGKENFSREILRFCRTELQCTYYELKYQMELEVLEPHTNSYNNNILNKFYPKNLGLEKNKGSIKTPLF